MKRILLALALLAGMTAEADSATTITYADIPSHVSLTFEGNYYGDFSVSVTGAVAGAQRPEFSYGSKGWKITAVAVDAGYKTPTFWVRLNGPSYQSEGEQYIGTTATNLLNNSLYVYNIQVEPETYNVTFNPNADGVAVDPSSNTVTYASTYGALPQPTRTGYTLDGWFTAPSGGTQVTAATPVSITAPQTLYAQWTPITYTVHFDAAGGSGSMADQTLTYGTYTQLTQNAFTKADYNFVGWTNMLTGATYSDHQSVQNLTNVQSAVVTLTALWSGKMYTITYHTNFEPDVKESDTFAYGGTRTLHAAISRPGYDFRGWATSPDAAEGNYTAGQLVNSSALPFENGIVHLYAAWKGVNYTVTYNANGGEGTMSPQSLTYDDPSGSLALNTFMRTGYAFLGWARNAASAAPDFTDGQATPNVTAFSETTPLYAVWQPVTYTVAFDANDSRASGEMEPFDLDYGVVTNLPACAFEKDGYDFLCWTNEQTGATYADCAAVSNLTANAGDTVTNSALWKAQSYSVTFDANGGAFAGGATTSNVTVTVDETYGELPVLDEDVHPLNRVFGGWRFQTNNVWTVITADTVVPPPSAGATTLQANWVRDAPEADALDIPTTQDIPFELDNEYCDTNWTVVATEPTAVGGTCLSASMPDYGDEDVDDKKIVITGQFAGKGVLTFSWKIVSNVIGTKWTGFYDPDSGTQPGSPEQLKFYVGDEFRHGMAATDSLKLTVTSEDDMTTEPVPWTPAWQTVEVQIGEEGVTNTVRWEMFAQHNDATGSGYAGGTAWLDNVRWEPEGGSGGGEDTPTDIAVPVLVEKVFTGATLTADVPLTNVYTVVTNEGGIAAGDYTVWLTLTDAENTRWADSAAATRNVPWRIAPKALTAAMVAGIADQEYTGVAIAPDVTVTDAERGVTLESGGDYSLSFSGNEDAGEATATVTGIGNYTGVVSKTFTILKKTVAVPEIASKVYNRSAQTADVPDSTEYNVAENDGGTDVGEYDVKLQLRDPANCKWPDAEGSDLVVKFSITKATYDMTGAGWDYAGAFEYDGTQKTVNVSGLPEGVDVVSCTGNAAVEPGTYTAHATLSYDTANYYEPSIDDLDWEIKANSAWTLHETFAAVGEVTSDAAGLKVMLTNDVSGTIELPDNLGGVTIDLNGHDMVGSDGEDAEAALTPGADGHPAILVVAAEGEGAPTTIAITNSQSDVEVSVSGGKGGEGTPPGNGGKSVDMADGVRPGVSFDIDESIQVSDGESGEEWTRELVVGKYFKMTLVELGYDVPTNGTPYSVVAKGLPSGLKLKYNAAVKNKKGKVTKKAKVEWWIEGVPTAALDYDTNPTYLVITANGTTTPYALPIKVREQEVENLGDFPLGTSWNVQDPLYLPNITNGWTVSGLPTGLKYAAKLLTTKKKVGKKTVVTTNALPYTAYGKTTKAGLFTITAKKKKGAYYETMKYRMLILPKDPDPALFGDDLSDISSMAYDPVEWDLMEGGSVGRLTLPAVSAVGVKVAKVTGLPKGLSFAATDTYAYKNAKKKTGKYLKQKGQTIIGTPTKTGTYVVTFTKNVKSGKKTVAKTAQILWKVTANDAELSLGFNDAGGVIESGTVGLKYGDLLAFDATSNATVTASGLPKGISLAKLGDGNWGLKGFTTKAGTYLVTVKATLKGKTVTQRIALKVDGLPAWAKGTFNGYVWGTGNGEGGTGNGEGGTGGSRPVATNGLATVTVSSVGKISGKFHDRGTNWTFSASSYTGYDPDATNYTVAVTAKYAYKVKSGKKTVTKYVERKFALTVTQGEFGGVAMLEEEAGSTIEAWQNLWGSTYKAVGKKLFSSKSGKKTLAYKVFSFDGTAVGLAASEKLSLKVTTAGAVTATLTFDTGKTKKDAKKKTVKVYYKPTCKTVVIPTSAANPDAFTGEVILYFAPSAANAFPRSAGTVELTSAE